MAETPPTTDASTNGHGAVPVPDRRARIAEARRQLDRYLDLGAIDPAIALWKKMMAAGDGWPLDAARLNPIIDHLRAEKRWKEAAPLMVDLIQQSQQRLNGLRITLAQIAVKKLEEPDMALDALAAIDHRSMTAEQRDVAIEMQGRARRQQLTDGADPPPSSIGTGPT